MALLKVKDRIITTYKTAMEKEVDDFEKDVYRKLIIEMELKTPTEVIHKFFKDDNSLYKQVDNKWNESITHPTILSNKTSHILVLSLCNYKLTNFIQSKFNFTITKTNNRMSYDYNKFLELCKMEITLLLNKYNYELYISEIQTAIVKVLFTFFEVYTFGADITGLNKNIWLVNSQAILDAEEYLLNTYIRDFTPYKFQSPELKKLNNCPEEKVRSVVRKGSKSPKPKTLDDIKFLFTDDMTQAEKAEAVKEYYGYNSLERARKVMNQLGEKRVYRKIKRDIDKTKNEIINSIKESKDDILLKVEDSLISITSMLGTILNKVSTIDDSNVKKDIIEIKDSINDIKEKQDRMFLMILFLYLKLSN